MNAARHPRTAIRSARTFADHHHPRHPLADSRARAANGLSGGLRDYLARSTAEVVGNAGVAGFIQCTAAFSNDVMRGVARRRRRPRTLRPGARQCSTVVRICIVLGAGSSFANAKYFRPARQQSSIPPLDYTFFDKIKDLGIPIPTELRRYAEGLPTGNPFIEGGRMEEFLRDLFHDFLGENDNANSEPVRAYRQMVEIYAGVLRRTTDWMHTDGYTGGPVGRIIAAAADIADHVDIITFNHDLVIENEIYKRARLRQRWCITKSYGAFSEGRTPLVWGSQARFHEHTDDCNHERPIVIHKMHGSLNWYVRIRGTHPTPGVLAGRVSTPDVMISQLRSVREMRRVQMRPVGSRGRGAWNVWPVIVPPIYAKQALIQSFMPSVWTQAKMALANSDRMIFLGYSLPLADIEAEKLFQRTVTHNDNLPWVGVVDPATSVVGRVAGLMPHKPLRRWASADSFLDGEAFDT